MAHDFDTVIDRSGTHATKFDDRQRYFGTEDIDPLWVADMDFAAPACVTQALVARAQHPIYGYTLYPESLYEAVIQWYARRHHWQIQREWMLVGPSALPSLAATLQAVTEPDDGIIIQPPVYTEFAAIIHANRRRPVLNPLIETDGHYTMDFAQLEQCASQGARILLLCSPHNPVGRVWSTDELHEVLRIARRHHLTVVSDDIHCDLTYSGARHTMLGSLAQAGDKIITSISPGKTFNLQGMGLSALVIPDEEQRKAIIRAFESMHLDQCHPFSITAFETAYREGGEWLDALLAYLETTRDFVADYLRTHIPRIRLVRPQATYLLWLDCRGLGMDDATLRDFFIRQCKVGMNPGAIYGAGGSGFMRMNIGAPRERIRAALESIRAALAR
ncbi:putative C-S lyase [Rhodanobacter glycinis]|uniref:cysteine-S-conjugate beta-lyase n=1 Tax=Rhodanobacter glycinis TaxID=582702 RepID=A0A5B9E2C6_9GAMM|nr:PatB family C-S lyase [Rhodanobacter glycinis]QEE25125.1 putative C-S lyase [Rhodanobacter glycinis]